MSLDTIDAKARVYSEARERLAAAVAELQQGIEALKRAFELETELRALVEAHPQLFVKPRTVVLHGIKCGFQKGKGKITFADADQVVALIEKKLPELADVLIATKKEPVKKALGQLDVKQLRAIGCQVTEADDQVVVTATDDAIDKLVASLLKALGDKAADEEAAAA